MNLFRSLSGRKKYTEYTHKINALSFRERLIIAVSGALIVLFLWDQALLSDQLQARKNNAAKIADIENKLKQQIVLQTALREKLAQDPTARERQHLAQLEIEMQRIDKELESKALSFVSSQQMVKALRDMLQAQNSLSLLRIELKKSLPVFLTDNQAINITTVGDTPPADKPTLPNVYRHRFELEVEGSYLDMLAYVQQLEKMSWHIRWQAVDIRTKDYPRAIMRLELETMSLTEGWIGV
ncbi:MAG: hypothetical protein H0W44_01470 [Gammaproteobacteria bacterium]|nr:hypothetical protein [Gammaproteobacteria bacterium]